MGKSQLVVTRHNDVSRGGEDEDYLVIYERDRSIIPLSARGVEEIVRGRLPVIELAIGDLEPPANLTQIEREHLARQKIDELHKLLDQQGRGE